MSSSQLSRYLKVKLDGLFTKLQEEEDMIPITWHSGQGGVCLLKYLFFTIHPYLSTL